MGLNDLNNRFAHLFFASTYQIYSCIFVHSIVYYCILYFQFIMFSVTGSLLALILNIRAHTVCKHVSFDLVFQLFCECCLNCKIGNQEQISVTPKNLFSSHLCYRYGQQGRQTQNTIYITCTCTLYYLSLVLLFILEPLRNKYSDTSNPVW